VKSRGPVSTTCGVGALLFFPLLVALALPPAGVAQEGWDDDNVLELIRRARAVRQSIVVDSGLVSYSADARGYVYFFVHRDGTEERNLVKTDQVALEVYWRAPDQARQRIVGLRDEKELPTDIHYHLDHLTVVQDDFGDRIRLGDGDEVSAVIHPLAPGSDEVYEFRLADSLTVRFMGLAEPIRVYEIQVRPRDLDQPGFVGSVFVDRSTGAVVRMRFTFTPSSYVDPYLDYIRISLDNALWDGRYWLPHQQEVELRREVPFFDFPMGTVIRGRFRITGYELNEPLSDRLFAVPRVTSAPEAALDAFQFEQDLYAEIEAEGLGPAPDLDEIRDEATSLARNRYLGGLGPLRLYTPAVSSVLRYNRAEGTVVGGGVSYRPGASLGLRASAAYAFGREQGQVRVAADGGQRWPDSYLVVSLNVPRDIGPIAAASGAVNTITSLAGQNDFQDLYFSSGVHARQGVDLPGAWKLDVTTRWERQRSATDVVSGGSGSSFRPVLETADGDLLALDVDLGRRVESGFDADASVTVASFEGTSFSVAKAGLGWSRKWLQRRGSVETRLEAGMTTDDAPPQSLFLLGGRSTMPGYDFRGFVGDRYWFARADGTVALAWPWLTARGFAAAGGTSLARDALPLGWPGEAPQGARTSLGVGVDLFWDVVRVEMGRGLSEGGAWEFNLFASKRFWPVL